MNWQIRKTVDRDEGYRLGESLAELTQYIYIYSLHNVLFGLRANMGNIRYVYWIT